MRRFLKGLCMVVLFLVLLLVGLGGYIGNRAFQEFRQLPWDHVLGIENHSRNVDSIKKLEKKNDWQPVRINGLDNTILRGTYIKAAHRTHKTVILLHGLYQNRSMCLPYVPIYQRLGYNVLLVDLRGHGESEGNHTDWGLSEMDDLQGWVLWLKQQDKDVRIGLHGVSLGAAMAILYAGSDRNHDVSFVVADSSYGNIIALGREKLMNWVDDDRILLGYDVLDPFFQGAMFFHTHKIVSSIEPDQAVQRIDVPILFLHGRDDSLVPDKTAQRLYDDCKSPHKYLYMFSNSPHAVGIETNRDEYVRVVSQFLINNVGAS